MSRLLDLPRTPLETGITVIEASAGTGKTYCLVGLVLRLLLERRVRDVSELLVVTFTQAATQELVERLRTALTLTYRLLTGEATHEDPFFQHLAKIYREDEAARRLAREALIRFDELTVSTLHGFCWHVLEDSAFESGEPFEGELVEDAAGLLREAARDVWRQLLYPPTKGSASQLVAAVITESALTPESFLKDFELSQRHPHTEILPPAPDLETARLQLNAAHKALRESWDLPAIQRLLERRRFLRGAYFSGGSLRPGLAAAGAFCTDLKSSGLRPVLELAGERLESSLFKRDRTGVVRHAVVRACTAFSQAVEEFHHTLRCRFVADVSRRFHASKRSSRIWSYDDLLRRLRQALDDPRHGSTLAKTLRRRYRAVLIDEFQDTDLIQYQIFHRLFHRGPLILIGDPKQAIYRFRGADVFAYLAARNDADRTYTLGHNWRTEQPLVEAVNAVFSRPPTDRPFVFEQIAFEPAVAARRTESTPLALPDTPGARALQWIWVPKLRTRQQARHAIERAVATEITRLLSSKSGKSSDGQGAPLSPDDIAVLVRTNEQASSLQSALRALAIPSVIGRSGNIFHSEAMADLEALLRAIVEPGDRGRLRAAWATRLWGTNDQRIRDLQDDEEAFARRLEELSALRRDWQRRGFMPMIQRFFAKHKVRLRLLASLAGERRLTNLIHATEVLHRAERVRHFSPAALLGWLTSERAGDRSSTETSEWADLRTDVELRLESDATAVQIVTVHRSKGLEYEVVFCPFLWQARGLGDLPVQAHVAPSTPRAGLHSRLVLDYGSKDLDRHRSRAEAERLSEEARLAYVALTRARRQCYVVWGDIPGRYGPEDSALGYLLHRGAPFADRSRPASSDPLPGQFAEQARTAIAAGRSGWFRDLGRWIGNHEDVMELRSLEEISRSRGADHKTSTSIRDLKPRRFVSALPRPWSLESFSSLSRPDPVTTPSLNQLRRETPDVVDPPMPEALRPLSPAEPSDTSDPAEPTSLGPRSIVAFARGRRAGSCLHRVLERCDLARLDPSETQATILEALRRYGLEESDRHLAGHDFDPAGAVQDLLCRLAAAELPKAGFRLGGVPRACWLVEWKFTLPLGCLTPQRLAQVFREHGPYESGSDGHDRVDHASDYAPHLESLGRTAVHGYLTGFVDLIFEHDGRWYLLDWKSNDLGPNAASYGQSELYQAMSHHHYILQYHLYQVALHRFLRTRIPDYAPERHLAGAYYVFLRGISGPTSTSGWYVDRPSPAMIEALDQLMGDGA